jgi:large subunit ribosomal protein L21
MYAIVLTGGKQYKVEKGETVFVEKLDAKAGDTLELDVMMVVDGDTKRIGTPMLEGVKATATVLSQGKEKKVIIFKYKAKKNIRKKTGHRQPYTKIQIESIG